MSAPAMPDPMVQPGTVVVSESGSGLTQYLLDGRHRLIADEPLAAGGSDLGPGPYELLLMALGACTSMTVRLYAKRKGWPLDHVTVRLSHMRDYAKDTVASADKPVLLDRIDCAIELTGRLDDAQRARLLVIANSCPVHRSLTSKTIVTTKLVSTEA